MRIPKISLGTALLALACGQSGDTGDPTMDPQAALDHHGDVAIEMLTADNQERSPYEETAVISISLDYLECLARVPRRLLCASARVAARRTPRRTGLRRMARRGV